MSAADPTPLDALTDESRAILSLLLVQDRSYHEISELLRIDSTRVRERTHAAIEALAPNDPHRPGAAVRARIADYLVGEQSVSDRARTRALLAGSQSDRAWAAEIALALAPLARDALPAIPDPIEPIEAIEPAAPTDRGERLPRALIACLGLFGAAAVAVILVLAGLGGGNRRTPTVANEAGQTITRLTLTPAGTDRNAFGAAAIVRPDRGGLLLELRGRGLPANQNDSYAVWLFNTPGDSRLLGFISPGVSAAGTFSSRTALPADAVRFRELVVTRETTSRPPAPGQAVLTARLRLS